MLVDNLQTRPVAAAIPTDFGFQNLGPGAYWPQTNFVSHGVVIIGYSEGEGFRARNSFGNFWGPYNDGTFYLHQ